MMQTYSRGRRARSSGAGKNRDVAGPSEAGKLSALGAVRQREVRENGDFLRVVVMEMNMRREGKLEMGRAKIWLPPRKVAKEAVAEVVEVGKSRVPRRWVGVTA